MDQVLEEAARQNQTETKRNSKGEVGAFGRGTRPSGLQPSPLEEPLFFPRDTELEWTVFKSSTVLRRSQGPVRAAA